MSEQEDKKVRLNFWTKLSKRNRIIIGSVAGALLLIVVLLTVNATYKMRMMFAGRKVVTLLFVGTDEEHHRGRTDSIFVGFYNTATKKAGLVVVPRDIRVRIRGLYDEKVNALYARQGLGALKGYLEDLLGQPIHYFAILDLENFSRLIDLVGPITVFNDHPLRYSDHAGELYIDLPGGEVELDGAKAEGYVRFRADERSDAGRSERQMEIIQILARKILQERDALRDLRILRTLLRGFRTDMPFHEILWFIRNVGRIDLTGLETMRIPGVLRDIRGQSYIDVDPDSVRSRVREFLLKLNTITAEFDPSLVTVQVLNGSGVPGLAARVRTRLIYFGFNVVEFGNADRDDYEKTMVLDRSGNAEAARRIYEILKIGGQYPKIDRRLLVDVTVVAGRDLLVKK
jgi:LCP family protein required for cell wall assembly